MQRPKADREKATFSTSPKAVGRLSRPEWCALFSKRGASTLRLVFMGTADFAVPSLELLAQSQNEIIAVVTRPDKPAGRGRKLQGSPVKLAALRLFLRVVQPPSIKDPSFIRELASMAPELIVVVAFGAILPAAVLRLPKFGCVNLHASLLPRYRGPAPIHWAIINGSKETGVTTIFMDEKVDTGDIILQERVPILDSDNAGTLHDKLARVGAQVLVRSLELIERGVAPRTPQLESEASYARALGPEDEVITWEHPAEAVWNKIRGMTPWPGAYTRLNGLRLKVLEGEWRARELEAGIAPGTVLSVNDSGMEVACGDGVYVIKKLQLEGGKPLSVAEFRRGHVVLPGTVLGGLTVL